MQEILKYPLSHIKAKKYSSYKESEKEKMESNLGPIIVQRGINTNNPNLVLSRCIRVIERQL